MAEPTEVEIQAGALAVLLAVLDGECDDRMHELLCGDDPHHALHVAHKIAHMLVESVDECDHAEMRADVAARALELRGQT